MWLRKSVKRIWAFLLNIWLVAFFHLYLSPYTCSLSTDAFVISVIMPSTTDVQSAFRGGIGKETAAMCLAKETRKQYDRMIKKLFQWLAQNVPQCVSGNDIILPLPTDVVKDFIYHVSLKRNKHGEYHDPPQFYKDNHIAAYVSAIKDLYRTQKIAVPFETALALKEQLAGTKRRIADLKAKGEIPSHDGKQPISEAGYRFLAEKAMKNTEDISLYVICHTYLVLCWNLIARAVTVGEIVFDQISWEEDALTIYIGKMKNDQEGSKGYARHVYANPNDPMACPVLSLAILVFSRGYSRDGSVRYIFGETAKDRFSSWLSSTLKKFAESILALGIIICEIGSHSFRKGVATLLSNMPGGPSAVSVFLRAGWSLGAVQSRYIFEGSGGDQYCGRAAAGLSINDPDFAILPPHFDQTDGSVLSVAEWEDILPGYSSFYPSCFRVTLPYLLASLVYHREWLVKTLPGNHLLFQQRVWTSGVLERLAPKVHIGVFRNDVTKMKATGIPPYVKLNQQLIDLRGCFNDGVSTLQHHLNDIPTAVKDSILSQCEINGVVPVTRDLLQEMMANLRHSIVEDVAQKRPSERDKLFAVAFDEICRKSMLNSELPDLDRRRVGELSYITLYDYCKSPRADRKRKRVE